MHHPDQNTVVFATKATNPLDLTESLPGIPPRGVTLHVGPAGLEPATSGL